MATSTALARRHKTGPGAVDDTNTEQAVRGRHRSLRQLVRRLIVSIREGDEHQIEDAVLQLSKKNRIFAPLALAVGAFAMLFGGLRLLVTNWRLMLVQVLPAMLIWATTIDLKAHVLHGKEFHDIRGPIVLVLFAAAVLVTTAAFYLNAAFAFTISQPGSPQLRTGFDEARKHAGAILYWGVGTGLALGVAAVLAPRWGLGWFALLLGIVLGVLMVCYIAVPARIVGVGTPTTAKAGPSGRDKLAASAVSGILGAIVCAPAYAIVRIGLILLGSQSLFWLGVAILVVGLMLQAGVTGAVKAVKVSAKLLVGQPLDTSDGQSASVPDG
jgi:hypothetical protein